MRGRWAPPPMEGNSSRGRRRQLQTAKQPGITPNFPLPSPIDLRHQKQVRHTTWHWRCATRTPPPPGPAGVPGLPPTGSVQLFGLPRQSEGLWRCHWCAATHNNSHNTICKHHDRCWASPESLMLPCPTHARISRTPPTILTPPHIPSTLCSSPHPAAFRSCLHSHPFPHVPGRSLARMLGSPTHGFGCPYTHAPTE